MSKTTISAKVVADSINEFGHRITTLVLVMPRIILAEFNTHRMFSRNSASSRAIPFTKMSTMIESDPFIPLRWMKDHKGMQGSEYLETDAAYWATQTWIAASEYARKQATILNERYEVTKQYCNRLLEPFMWHTVLVTATEWENFFALRAHEAAETHMQALAECMLSAMNSSEPRSLLPGQWHIPYGDDMSGKKLYDVVSNNGELSFLVHPFEEIERLTIKVATARAARTSYTLPDSVDKHDYVKDISLHDRLTESGHWSAFEHCAVNMNNNQFYANFKGWEPYRKTFNNENRSDSRLIKRTWHL